MQKKRGRKPKGGQVIKKSIKKKVEECNKNIILHLKVIDTHNDVIKEYNFYNNTKNIKQNNNNNTIQCKLKNLQYDLHTNSIYNNSNCFWCTGSFKHEPIYIPSSFINNKYKVYGNFCTPQCAAAYLFDENIDSTIKYNRYSLLNSMYKELFTYNKNIIPAPKPFYILDKFLGNLSIEEYRNLVSKNDTNISIVDKPISNIFPELHSNSLSSI